MSKLDDILRQFSRDAIEAYKTPLGKPFGPQKQQIQDLMIEVFKSCEHDGSFVSVSAFEKKVKEL